jgi:carboxyl-terminal processing protease
VAQSTVQIPGTVQPISQSSAPAITKSALADVLDKGRTFETERRWGEAFALYEEAVRKNPGQPDLERRLDLAKMHFDISRRYADASFRDSISKQSDTEALATYTDAATKVQSHYVATPEWARLVGRGNMNLEIALSEPTFVENNLPGVTTDRIDRFVTELRRTMSQRRVGNRNDARETVWAAAYLANTHLGLRPSATIMEYTAGMLGGLDEYSTFLTSGQLNDLYSQIEGNFVGLGVELKADDGALLIVNVVPKSPAQRGGIKPGDRIIEVAGRSTQDVTTDQAAELLQGEEGSYVKLVAVTEGESPRTLTIRREHVEVPSVENAKIVDPDFGIAYFKLSVFQKTTAQEVDTALWDLHRQGMRSLIIDLRRNPGGLLTSGVEVADRFVEQGSIVSTRGRSAGEDFNYTAKRNGTWRVPLVVLIDGDSASAAEILAGALRDHQRATIVGERSYGKGSVQSIFQLSNGGAGVRLTTAKFYSPLGKPFSRIGVEPEIAVQTVAKPVDGRIMLPVSNGNTEDDAILNAGIQAARRQVAQR